MNRQWRNLSLWFFLIRQAIVFIVTTMLVLESLRTNNTDGFAWVVGWSSLLTWFNVIYWNDKWVHYRWKCNAANR